ncbi:MAG: phytanoyl-CoA dioxygenase family protein [Aquabacterium sp.]
MDYQRHPAYAAWADEASVSWRLRAWRRFLPALIKIELKRAIQYEWIPLHVRQGRGLAGKLRFAAAAAGNLLRPRSRRNLAIDTPGLSALDLAFRRQGVAVVQGQAEDLARLRELSVPNFAKLEQRRSQAAGQPRDFEASRSYASRADQPALFHAIEAFFQSAGVLATASSYLGRTVRLIDVNPQINDPSDDFWRRIFPDRTDPQPALAYMHRDASGGDLKAIVYMSDVGPDNGPFGYVVGTHRMAPGRFDDHVCEANDSNGLAGTDPDSRRCFAALPSRLRQKGAFGNDLLDASETAQTLSRALWEITGAAGSVVLFDTKGVHRGGMVRTGERRVITCVLG